jgi:enterochelin esterase-like enzyme
VLLEPQSTALFILLMVVFCALLAWVALARQPVLRVLAASLAFVPAMLFGVAAVNKYYDYYQTWSAVAADVGSQGVSSATQISGNISGQRVAKTLGKAASSKAAAKAGELVRLTVTGQLSHLSRTVYVYLPPQYFQPAFAHARFPAIELINGFPGQPQDWINVVGIVHAYQTLLHEGTVKPAALVMPDANGGPRTSLQCLNVVRGPKDATFLSVDLENSLARSFRLRGSGPAWGVAGYSEGGFCAANLALVYPGRYGYAGVLSGYFKPFNDVIGNPPHTVRPFGSNLALRRKNTPLDRLRTLPLAVRIPKFWLGAGSYDHRDVAAAETFQQLLLARQPNVVLDVETGGSHNMATWRALVPPLLEWMTPRLAQAALPSPSPSAAPATPAGSRAAVPAGSVPTGPVPTGPAPTGRAPGSRRTPAPSAS